MNKKMKISLIALGSSAAIAAPVATVVACGVGTFFKNQIGSESEAKKAATEIINEMVQNGKRTDHTDKWVANYNSFNFYDGLDSSTGHVNNSSLKYDQTKLKGAVVDFNSMEFGNGNKVAFSAVKINSSYYKFSLTPATLSDGSSKVKILIVYQITKQDGGSLVKLFQGDAFSGWAHNVVGGAVLPETATVSTVHQSVDGMDDSDTNWFSSFKNDVWKWWN